MKTVRLTAAAALVRFLKRQYVARDGVEHRMVRGVAGIFGHGNVAGLGQALEELGGCELPFYQPKNEQAMVHMAVAFAKAQRRLGTLACTTSVGPGATNMVTGAATATIDRLPVLLLPSDVFASRLPAPVLQQLEHRGSMDTSVNDCFRPVSRWWDRIQRPEQLLATLPEAMRVLASPVETGAVTLCLPEDVQAEAYDYPENFFEKKVYTVARPACTPDALAAAVEAVRGAARPFLIAGGGVAYSEAEAALLRFVERTGIPVGVTQAGKGTVPDAHPQCLGGVGATGTEAANRLAAQADLVLAVGTRLSDFTTASKSLFENPRVQFVHVQIDPYDAHKHGGLPLLGDARRVLEDLDAALPAYRVSEGYAQEIASARAGWERTWNTLVHPVREPSDNGKPRLYQSEVLRILNEHVGPESTIVHAAGGLPGDLHKLWRAPSWAAYHAEYGYSCMGYEIAGALGVKLAHPERDVYALVGDGSYLMLHTEIVTAVQEGLKIVVVLFDNGGYQCIHGLQRACGGVSFGNEFRARSAGGRRLDGERLAIDYVQNARSLGALAFRADTDAALREALDAARQETRTTLIHVPVDPEARLPGFAWWDVPMLEISDHASVTAARHDYETARGRQRFYYRGER